MDESKGYESLIGCHVWQHTTFIRKIEVQGFIKKKDWSPGPAHKIKLSFVIINIIISFSRQN